MSSSIGSDDRQLSGFGTSLTEPVTVLMPVRNGESTVQFALRDLARGMQSNDELLVIDDGSEDQTEHLLGEMQKEVPQLRVIRTSQLGLVSVLNIGVREASSNWIARADADDRYPIDRLKYQRVARDLDVGLVTGDYRIDGPSRSTTIPCALGSPFVSLSLLHPQRIPHPGVLFHREAFQMAGGYRDVDFPAEDLGLWMRMSRECRMIGVPRQVVYWRIHPASTSHQRQSEQRQKTRELMRDFSFPNATSINADAVEEELMRYESTTHRFEREVLLARDVLAGRRVGVRSSAAVELSKRLIGHGPSTISAVVRLHRDASVRRRLRALMDA